MDRLPRELRRLLCAALALTLAPTCLPAQASAKTPPPPDLYLGAAWYPEQWPKSRWDADLTLMQEAGVRFVRAVQCRSQISR